MSALGLLNTALFPGFGLLTDRVIVLLSGSFLMSMVIVALLKRHFSTTSPPLSNSLFSTESMAVFSFDASFPYEILQSNVVPLVVCN